MSDEKCLNTKDSNLKDLQTDAGPLTCEHISVQLMSEPDSDLDHFKAKIMPTTPEPNPVQLTPEPDSNLDPLKTDAIPITPEPHPVKLTHEHSLNLNHRKANALPPALNSDQKKAEEEQLVEILNEEFKGLSILSGQRGRLQPKFGVISCSNLQIGNGNVMSVPPVSKGHIATQGKVDKEKLAPYLESSKELTRTDFQRLSKFLGKDWQFIGRYLGIDDSDLDAIDHDHKENLKEKCYRMLMLWFKKDPSQCTIGNFARALNENENFDVIYRLPLK